MAKLKKEKILFLKKKKNIYTKYIIMNFLKKICTVYIHTYIYIFFGLLPKKS